MLPNYSFSELLITWWLNTDRYICTHYDLKLYLPRKENLWKFHSLLDTLTSIVKVWEEVESSGESLALSEHDIRHPSDPLIQASVFLKTIKHEVILACYSHSSESKFQIPLAAKGAFYLVRSACSISKGSQSRGSHLSINCPHDS